jgi:hypothetical protein
VKIVPRWPQKAQDAGKIAQGGPKVAPRAPKIAPASPHMAQDEGVRRASLQLSWATLAYLGIYGLKDEHADLSKEK